MRREVRFWAICVVLAVSRPRSEKCAGNGHHRSVTRCLQADRGFVCSPCQCYDCPLGDGGKHMANPKSKAPKKKKGPDALVASRDVTLTEEEMSKACGGAADIFAKIGDIKGESIDDKHKDEIEVLSRGPRLPGGRTFR